MMGRYNNIIFSREKIRTDRQSSFRRKRFPCGQVRYLKTGTELLLFRCGDGHFILIPFSFSSQDPPYHHRPHVQIPEVPTELVEA